jgi:hypothetical protein
MNLYLDKSFTIYYNEYVAWWSIELENDSSWDSEPRIRAVLNVCDSPISFLKIFIHIISIYVHNSITSDSCLLILFRLYPEQQRAMLAQFYFSLVHKSTPPLPPEFKF